MILDAFHGAGGWAEGLRELGCESVGVEYDPDMVATSRAAGHEVVLADVAAIDPRELVPEGERCEGVIASPPCPSFSNGGKPTLARALLSVVLERQRSPGRLNAHAFA